MPECGRASIKWPCRLVTHVFSLYVVNGRLTVNYTSAARYCSGVPFNIASYAALMMMVAQECGLRPESSRTPWVTPTFISIMDGLREQLTRTPKKLPTLKLPQTFWDLKFEDFELSATSTMPLLSFQWLYENLFHHCRYGSAPGIGVDNCLPWHLSGDLKHFARTNQGRNRDYGP